MKDAYGRDVVKNGSTYTVTDDNGGCFTVTLPPDTPEDQVYFTINAMAPEVTDV